MIPYSELAADDEGSLLKPQPTVREVTNSLRDRCNICHAKVFLIILGFIGLVFALGRSMGLNPALIEEVVTIKGNAIIHNTSEQFLSVALDTSIIQERLMHLNLLNPIFLQRTKVFSPGFLRVGGTTADRLIFEANSTTRNEENEIYGKFGLMDGDQWAYERMTINKPISNFTMTGDDWVMINKFAKDAGLKLLFDLNVLLRHGDTWDSSNAEELIKFSNDHGFDIAWQLGNEPNSFPHVFHTNISGKQLGEDFATLKKILDSFPHYANTTLVGPDVTRPKFISDPSIKYLTEFLKSGGKSINAVTWHQYYLNGREAYLADFINPHTFNLLYKQILAIKLAVTDVFNTTKRVPIWISETGSAYGGGAPHLSNRFVASFMWLDKLGIAAQMGIDVVIRQSLFHGYYSLLQDVTFKPYPDWWISVIYKTLVGHKVLQTSSFTGAVRLYCHCTPLNASQSTNGTATLFGMNMFPELVKVSIRGLPIPTHISKVDIYILTGGKNGRLSEDVLLNGNRLKLKDDGSMPPFIPLQFNYDETIIMAPFSIGFFVLHGTSVPACK